MSVVVETRIIFVMERTQQHIDMKLKVREKTENVCERYQHY
jgi:hypothetical protein